MIPYVLIWGGGDLASGVAIRLHRSGIRLLVIEQQQPLAVRLSVAFARAVFESNIKIEEVQGRLIQIPEQMKNCWQEESVPVLVDPGLNLLPAYRPLVVIDARMRKKTPDLPLETASLVIGLGPGFTASDNCHAAIETNRGHFLGRVCWEGSPQRDTGVPGKVQGYGIERVFFAPLSGEAVTYVSIGDWVNKGDRVVSVGKKTLLAPFDGLIRGLIHPGVSVNEGTKLGDIDPRHGRYRCWTVSEKSLAIGGGVLEALLTRKAIRNQLWMM